ncbi:MFS transporter [Nocardioides sp. CFH 31398]|uniref:MFS transporter n=1 Tax=Nocardioides sp. CFH 31398 TaxID=2919579 RepID=UPI001F06856A|nr:MFS transporter [Nocardioides sp. CFH 31398]MCH1866921.1 MFS transporter [Nocardioides sp. CFH 31398]
MAGDGVFPTHPFLRYWRASAVSGLGTYVTLLALQALVVLTLDGSAVDVGLLNAARWLPFLLLGLVVGAVVDGRRRLPLMVSTDLVQAGLLILLPLLWWAGLLSMPSLLVVVAAYGAASVVNAAADMSLLPRLVAGSDLQRAHARLDGADAVASTGGPALGGLLVNVVGAPLTVLLDAATYLYSALTLRRLGVDEPPARTGVTVRDLLHDVAQGFRWAYGSSGLAPLALTAHGWFAAHAAVMVVLAPYSLVTLGLSAAAFGLVGAAGGAGALLGALVTTVVGRRLGTGWTVIACHAATTVAVLAMVAAGSVGPGGAAMGLLVTGQVLYGVAMGASNSHEMSYRQLVTPDELQARTNTSLRALNRGVVVVVAPLAGLLADTWSLAGVLALAAVGFAVVTVALAATPFRRVRVRA